MAVIDIPPDPTTTGGARPALQEAEPVKPIKWWAAVGAGVLALEAYVFAHWIISGNATPTPTGSTPVPLWMKVMAHTWEVVGVVALAWCIWHFVIAPYRRERTLTVDGMLVLAFFTLFWQDPLLNYNQTWATYNATFINFGNWGASLPGWVGPTGHLMAEPIIWTLPVYVYASMLAVVSCTWMMRKAKERRPSLGVPGLIGVAFVYGMVFDFVVETIWLRLGIYTYAGAIEWLTFFSGRYYQFPIYEVVLAGAMFGAFGALRYFLNDRGMTVAERGVDELRVSHRAKLGVRFLAVVGIVNVLMFVTYNLPMQWFAIHADAWPEDITERSYLTNGICGPETDYACSGPDIPIPRPDSVHISPDGQLVIPEGTTFTP